MQSPGRAPAPGRGEPGKVAALLRCKSAPWLPMSRFKAGAFSDDINNGRQQQPFCYLTRPSNPLVLFLSLFQQIPEAFSVEK